MALCLLLSILKPILLWDAKYLASGVGVGQCPRRQNFALEIPTCWYLGANAKCKICVTPNTKYKICVTPDANPDASQWNIGGVGFATQDFRAGYVHFMLFMSISFASGTQRKLVFQWNMGLRHVPVNSGPAVISGGTINQPVPFYQHAPLSRGCSNLMIKSLL